MYDEMNHGRVSTLQERVNVLKDQGYRGFTILSSHRKFDGVEVVVSNSKGKELKAEGETLDEAYENAVEIIDYTLDN